MENFRQHVHRRVGPKLLGASISLNRWPTPVPWNPANDLSVLGYTNSMELATIDKSSDICVPYVFPDKAPKGLVPSMSLLQTQLPNIGHSGSTSSGLQRRPIIGSFYQGILPTVCVVRGKWFISLLPFILTELFPISRYMCFGLPLYVLV